MSILIQGMEMPVTCCHCPLMGYDPDREWFDNMARTGAHICVLTGELIDNTKREEHCPLVPVPPHGRLGDLDEIIRYKERLVVDADKINPAIRYVVDTKYIEGTPTIIPAEEGET